METTIIYWGYIGVMEKKMETTIIYWGYIGVMEKKTETVMFARLEEVWGIARLYRGSKGWGLTGSGAVLFWV